MTSQETSAHFNPETSILIQQRHPYTGNLNSETSWDSKKAFLHCEDLLESRGRVQEQGQVQEHQKGTVIMGSSNLQVHHQVVRDSNVVRSSERQSQKVLVPSNAVHV